MHPEDSEINKKDAPLFGLPKKNIYEVPGDFFVELESDIRRKYPHRKKGLLLRLKKAAQFSVAAAIALLVVFSGIKIFQHKEYMPVETMRTIYTVQDGDKDGE